MAIGDTFTSLDNEHSSIEEWSELDSVYVSDHCSIISSQF